MSPILNRFIEEAKIVLDNGDLDKAIKILEEARGHYSDDINVYLHLGACYCMELNYRRAKEMLEEGLRHNSRSAPLLMNLAEVLHKIGEDKEAKCRLKEAIYLEVDNGRKIKMRNRLAQWLAVDEDGSPSTLNWPMYRGYHSATGYSLYSPVFPIRNYEVKWQRDFEKKIYASMIAYEGGLIVAARDGTIYILNNRGKELNKFKVAGEISLTPCTSNGILYVAAGKSIYKFNFSSKSNVMQEFFTLSEEEGIVATHLMPFGTSLIFGTYIERFNRSCIYQLCVNDGSIGCFKELVGGIAQPVSDGELVIVATSEGEIVSFKLDNFQEVWRRQMPSGAAPNSLPLLAISEEFLLLEYLFVFDQKGDLYRIEAKSGEGFVSLGINLLNVNSFVITPKYILASGLAEWRCYDILSRNEKFREAGSGKNIKVHMATPEMIIVNNDNALKIYNYENPNYGRTIPIPDNRLGSCVVSNSQIFLCTENGKVLCLSY